MHHLRTKSPCSKNKTKKLNLKKIIMIFTANHCDFCCCLLEMCGFTLVSATLSYYFRNKVCFLSLSLCTSTILEKDCSQRFAVTNGIMVSVSRGLSYQQEGTLRNDDTKTLRALLYWRVDVEPVSAAVHWWRMLQVGWTKPPNPWNLLTEPLGFDRTQFKNHWSIISLTLFWLFQEMSRVQLTGGWRRQVTVV